MIVTPTCCCCGCHLPSYADQKSFFFVEYPFTCQPVLYYDFDKICAGEIFDESGSGNNGMSRGSVVVEAGYNEDNGVDLSDGFIQLDGKNFKVDNNLTCVELVYSILNLP